MLIAAQHDELNFVDRYLGGREFVGEDRGDWRERARGAAWRRSGGDPALFRVLMRAWLDAGRPPC